MNLRTRVERLEERAVPQGDDRQWQETLNRINKIYGDGAPLPNDVPCPTRAEVDAIIASVYGENQL